MCKVQGTLTSPIPPQPPNPKPTHCVASTWWWKNTLNSGTSLTASAKTRSTHLSWCDLDIMVCTHFTSYIYIYIYTYIYIYRIIHRYPYAMVYPSVVQQAVSGWSRCAPLLVLGGPGLRSLAVTTASMAYPTDQVLCLFQGGYRNIYSIFFHKIFSRMVVLDSISVYLWNNQGNWSMYLNLWWLSRKQPDMAKPGLSP